MGSSHHKAPPKEEEGLFHPSTMIRKNHSTNPLKQHYTLIEKLEEGSLSTVYRAVSNATKQGRVLKQLAKHSPNQTKSASQQKYLLNEYEILRELV